MCCCLLTDALDETSNKSNGKPVAEELYASSFGFLADQFEKHAVDITQRIQQLDYSADEFVSILPVHKMQLNNYDVNQKSWSYVLKCLLCHERNSLRCKINKPQSLFYKLDYVTGIF